jgi:hypothetical protein
MPKVTIEIPVEGEGDEGMAAAESLADPSVMASIMTGMATEAAAATGSRTRRFDQLAEDAASMWAVALTSPTVLAGMGFRVAQQSAGWPADSGTGTGGK